MKTLFTNAHVVDVIHCRGYGPVDILVEDGVIQTIGEAPAEADALIRDMKGRWVSPGLFNCHTHVSTPFFADPSQIKRTWWNVR